MGIQKRFRRAFAVLVITLATIAGIVGTPSPAVSAQTLTCSFTATGNGFRVQWDSTLHADRIVIERYALNRFWWRARSDQMSSQFDDGPAPRGGASMQYRVKAKNASGQIIQQTDCSLINTSGFSCNASLLPDGSYQIASDGQPAGLGVDFVVRRQVSDGGPFYWRQRTDSVDAIDSSSPTDQANYQVLARIDRRISAIANCGGDIIEPPVLNCDSIDTRLPLVECEALLVLNSRGLGITENTDPCTWEGVTCTDNRVTHLNVPGRGLSGSIPPELGNLTSLIDLELQFNDFTGPVPTQLGQLSKLESLRIGRNSLTGSIPAQIGNLTALRILQSESNQFSGPIPAAIGAATSLQRIDLSFNMIGGSIPIELGNLSDLRFLSLENNQLSGPIPSELGQLDRVDTLVLSDNQLTGSIPAELGQLDRLHQLNLDSNLLSGDITIAMTGIRDTVDFLDLRRADDGNCFTVNDPDLAQWLTSMDADWDSCPA